MFDGGRQQRDLTEGDLIDEGILFELDQIRKTWVCDFVDWFSVSAEQNVNKDWDVDMQYWIASKKSSRSVLKVIWEVSVKRPSGSSAIVESIDSVAFLSSAVCLVRLRGRECTAHGEIHVSGLFGPYPGQSTFAFWHFLHAGHVISQTRRRRKHCQHCRDGFCSTCAV